MQTILKTAEQLHLPSYSDAQRLLSVELARTLPYSPGGCRCDAAFGSIRLIGGL